MAYLGSVGGAVADHRQRDGRSELRRKIVRNAGHQQSCGLEERANLQQREMAAGAV